MQKKWTWNIASIAFELGEIGLNQQKKTPIPFQKGTAPFYNSKILGAMPLFLQNFISKNPEFCKKNDKYFHG